MSIDFIIFFFFENYCETTSYMKKRKRRHSQFTLPALTGMKMVEWLPN